MMLLRGLRSALVATILSLGAAGVVGGCGGPEEAEPASEETASSEETATDQSAATCRRRCVDTGAYSISQDGLRCKVQRCRRRNCSTYYREVCIRIW